MHLLRTGLLLTLLSLALGACDGETRYYFFDHDSGPGPDASDGSVPDGSRPTRCSLERPGLPRPPAEGRLPDDLFPPC